MKKLLFFMASAVVGLSMNAQVGATAPDFSVTDLDGNEINLYADILDQGIIAVVDVSATWCGPCWSLHQSHALQELHEAYGPEGTNQVRVIFYEGDADTGQADLEGTGGSTLGDWLDGITYPVVDEAPVSLDLSIWAPLGFPTVNVIRPSDYQIVADPWNVLTLEGQVEAISSSTGITLGVVGVSEVDATANINVFPNPTSDQATISLEGFDGQVTVQIFDLLGKEVTSFVTANAVEVISFADYTVGNYVLRVSNDTNEITKRISVVK